MSDDDYEALVAVAEEMAEAARAPILMHFRTETLAADNKDAAGFDPVTIADRAAEAAMRAILADRRPYDAILGEEEGASAGSTGLTWVLDPIDGTRAFISGAPVFGVLIGLHDGERPILGVVDQPHIGERFTGRVLGPQRGATLTHRGETRSIQTRRGRSLREATLLTTFPEVGRPTDKAGFDAVNAHVRLTRYGLDCYGYMLVALGQADLVIEAGLNAYDIQGPMAVIEAAGGVVTNWRGGPCDQGGQAVAAGDPALHEAALELLAHFAD